MTGVVNDALEAIIRITRCGPNGRRRRIRAVVDTGFNGTLTLPPELIAELALPWHRRTTAEVADGREVIFDVYRATVFWNRRRKRIHVDEADTMPLVGMELMRGSQMKLDICEGGTITIRPPRRRRER